jgi:hypothetical protein
VKDYQGYLLPYRPIIAAMLLAGQGYWQIARLIYQLGGCHDYHSTSQLIAYLDRRWEGRYKTPSQRKRGSVRHSGSWTPEDVWRETEGLQKGQKQQ